MNKADEKLLRKSSLLNNIIDELFSRMEKYYVDGELDRVEKILPTLVKVVEIKDRLF